MIDLHLHIDGSIPPATIKMLLLNRGIKSSLDDIKSGATASSECNDLNQYLSAFKLPLSVMQTEYEIGVCINSLIDSLLAINILYAELRFAPQLHTREGLTQEDVIRIAVSVLNNHHRGSDFCLILCCMRGAEYSKNEETIELASRYQPIVVGVDLAGEEGMYPTSDYLMLMSRARALNLNMTIHAGEASGIESIISAIDIGAKRIGHGLRLVDSQDLMERVKTLEIGIELCPTSNYQTKAITHNDEYPLAKFLRSGILVTVNSDNMTVSSTNVIDELEWSREKLGISRCDIEQLLFNSVRVSFLSEADKQDLLQRLNARLKQ